MSTAVHVLSTLCQKSTTWTLEAGRAITLKPDEAGEVLITRGGAWVTFDGPHPGLESGPLGDQYLSEGARLQLRANQRVVIEPFSLPRKSAPQAADSVSFEWLAFTPGFASNSWESTVSLPAKDLGRALHGAQSAFGRLVRGTLVWAARGLTQRPLAPILSSGGGRSRSKERHPACRQP